MDSLALDARAPGEIAPSWLHAWQECCQSETNTCTTFAGGEGEPPRLFPG